MNVGVICALVGLVLFWAAHGVLVVSLARRAWWRALLSLAVWPLAPWWGWAAGMRARALVWIAGLSLYALGAVVA